jgi:hypothetical protein
VWLLRDYAAQRWEKLCCIDQTVWPEPERMLLRSGWIAPLGIFHSGDNRSQKKIVFGTGTCVVFMVDLYSGGVLLPDILFKPDESIPGDFDDTYNYPAIGIFQESLVTLGISTEDTLFLSPVTKAWSDVLKWLPARSVLQASLVCREWRAMVTTDRFIRSHAVVHARSTRVMFVSDPIVGSFTDLEDHQINQPHLLGNRGLFRCSQPCHGLNLGSWNLRDYLYSLRSEKSVGRTLLQKKPRVFILFNPHSTELNAAETHAEQLTRTTQSLSSPPTNRDHLKK